MITKLLQGGCLLGTLLCCTAQGMVEAIEVINKHEVPSLAELAACQIAQGIIAKPRWFDQLVIDMKIRELLLRQAGATDIESLLLTEPTREMVRALFLKMAMADERLQTFAFPPGITTLYLSHNPVNIDINGLPPTMRDILLMNLGIVPNEN